MINDEKEQAALFLTILREIYESEHAHEPPTDAELAGRLAVRGLPPPDYMGSIHEAHKVERFQEWIDSGEALRDAVGVISRHFVSLESFDIVADSLARADELAAEAVSETAPGKLARVRELAEKYRRHRGGAHYVH